uniref:LIM zinc-binding domain-containing protein n=1 Tax=Trichuris muris TaxID=70415 RepID=A0A5S6QDS8_TRIMR
METSSLHSRTTGTGSPRVQFDPDALFEELDATLQLRSNKDSSYTRPGNSMQMKRDEETELDRLTNRLIHCMRTGKDECAICGLAISGKACVALDQTYHVECFTCVACGQNLAGKSFYLADGKHYCEKDFLDTLEKCASCYMPITEKILRAIGKSYHPLCFVCSVCSKCLDGVGFTVDESNRVHCVDCFHSKHAPRCATCMKPIVPERGAQESTRIIALDKSFHVNCYKCEDCGLLLSSSIEGHECYPLDNHLLCRSCNTARICQMTT